MSYYLLHPLLLLLLLVLATPHMQVFILINTFKLHGFNC